MVAGGAAMLAIVATVPLSKLLLMSWLGHRVWRADTVGTPAALTDSVMVKVIFELVSNFAREQIPHRGQG